MCRLLCSEWWHQVRFLKDCLRLTCQQDLSPPQVNYKYNLWLKLCNQVTEWLWNQVRPTLPARTRTKATSEAKVLNLSECDVPVKHLDVLSKGPKFCVEPALRPAELVSVSRSVARRVPEDSRTTCVAECTDVLLKHRPRRVHDIVMSSVVDFLHSSGLTCVVSDKEGFFVVLTRGLFSEKGSVAIAKNFREVSHNPSKIKKQAVELLKSLSLDKLVNKSVKECIGNQEDEFEFTSRSVCFLADAGKVTDDAEAATSGTVLEAASGFSRRRGTRCEIREAIAVGDGGRPGERSRFRAYEDLRQQEPRVPCADDSSATLNEETEALEFLIPSKTALCCARIAQRMNGEGTPCVAVSAVHF
ncbi:hypothetical protein HPB51_019501 [Rhipicephalus microplus]|uniref:Tick transposon n=1 Tax=Rhipicephalus microplus TaxID=6941 RepID=A0A9J6EBG0_RHIMP|nr:hypothetical protein HPB51_019501 [Rhipicephalus microplus]